MDPSPLESRRPDEFDLADPAVRAELIRGFAPRLAALLLAEGRCAPEALHETLVGHFHDLFAAPEPYDPGRDPSLMAWIYRCATARLLRQTPFLQRGRAVERLARLLQNSPHALSAIETGSILGIREARAEAIFRRPAAEITAPVVPPPGAVDVERILKAVNLRLEADPEPKQIQPGRSDRSALLREAAWAAGGIAILTAAIWFFSLAPSAGSGTPLFPTPTAPLPDALTIGTPVTHFAPLNRSDQETYFTSTEPILSADGQTIAFISDVPNLVEGDTNATADVFAYEVGTHMLHRVSLSPDGQELLGSSFGLSMSPDGEWIAYNHAGIDGTLNVHLTHWRSGLVEVIDRTLIGTANNIDLYSPGVANGGQILVFWGHAARLEGSGCPLNQESYPPCTDLFIYDRREGMVRMIPIGLHPSSWYSPTSLSADGRLIGLTMTPLDNYWARLGSYNLSEAVVYDWQNDQLTLLNRTPEGEIGNAASSRATISGDGSTAAFTSASDGLVSGDSDGLLDLFLRDLKSGETTHIPVGIDPDTTSATVFIDNAADRLSLSHDGRFLAFLSASPTLIPPDDPHCPPVPDIGSQCLGTFLFDRDTGITTRLDVEPLRRAGGEAQFFLYPSIDSRAEKITWSAFQWNFNTPCPPEGCTNIWLLNLLTGTFRLVNQPYRISETVEQDTGWRYIGDLSGPDGWANDVTIDADSRRVAVAGQDGTVTVSDLTTGELLNVFRDLDQPVNSVAFSPDGRWLAGGARDGSVVVWDLILGAPIFELFDHPGIVFEVAFSPDGKLLAVGAQNGLWIWTYTGEDFLLTGNHPQSVVTALAFTPDGRYLAASSDREVWLRKTDDGAILARLTGHDRRVLDVAFTPNPGGKYLIATAAEDKRVILWDLVETEAGPSLRYLSTLVHTDWVSGLAFTSDGGTLLTAGFDSSIHVWDAISGRYLHTLNRTRQDQVLAIALTGDDDTLVVGTVRGVRVWERGEHLPSIQTETEYFSLIRTDQYVEERPFLSNIFKDPQVRMNLFSDLTEALQHAETTILTLRELPETFTLESVAVYSSDSGATVGVAQTYVVSTFLQPATLTFLQTSRDLRIHDLRIGGSARVEQTDVLGFSAEYVRGGWGFGQALRATNTSTQLLRTWDPEAASLWLRWRDPEMSYSFYYDQPYNIHLIPEQEVFALADLIRLAESMLAWAP